MCSIPSRERQPFERLVRCRMVAKAGSIGLLVRMLRREVEECHQFFAVFLQAQRRLGIFGFIGLMNRSNVFSASALVSACQISCIAVFAFGRDSFGKQLRTFIVLCCQHRCWRVSGYTSSRAAQNPIAPSLMASFGAVMPRLLSAGADNPAHNKSARNVFQFLCNIFIKLLE